MKISIITANRDCSKYISTCVDSVRNQGYKDYEHIILDDCSKDKSPRVIKKLSRNDPHIKFIRSKKRLRCGASYVLLGQRATGDIVAVLDSDDALTKGAIKKIVRLYEDNPDVEYIWTNHWRCNPNLKKKRPGCSRHPGNKSLLDAGIEGKHCFSHWRTFRRSVLEKGQIFPSHLKSAVDKYMGYMLEEIAVGGFADLKLYKYRQRLTCLTTTYGRRNWERTKRKFKVKREEHNIRPYPIRLLT